MMISVAKYQLHPLVKLNAKSSLEKKDGLFVKIEKNSRIYLADYFPHLAFGDTSVDELLKDPFSNEYFQNALKLSQLVDDVSEYLPFKNHGFNCDNGSGVIKFKLFDHSSFTKLSELMESFAGTIRLDANGSFTIDYLNNFLRSVDYKRIEYIEDPSHEINWNDLIIASASDFISNKNANFRIVKPNRMILPKNSGQIISSYMGSDYGRILAYKYLMLYGDLNLVHGICTPNIYQEQEDRLFENSNIINKKIEKLIKEQLLDMDWQKI